MATRSETGEQRGRSQTAAEVGSNLQDVILVTGTLTIDTMNQIVLRKVTVA